MIEHAKALDYYQAIISRLAEQSSSMKGWAVSIATALVGFGAKDGPKSLALLALVPIAILWMLDSYYLAAERIFRQRFNRAAVEPRPQPTIDGAKMSAGAFVGALITPVNLGVYVALAAVALVIGYGLVTLGPAPSTK